MMFKHYAGKAIQGMLMGVAVQYLAAIALSLFLRLGYLLPYPVTFAERFGGELNAVLVTTLACGLAGAAVNIGVSKAVRRRQGHD